MTGYKLDIAFVIDATGTMGPIIELFKQNPLYLCNRIKEKMDTSGKIVDAMRVRVIDFADFAIEGKEAIHASKFFEIPQEQEQLERWVKNIQYEGRGGDEPENALEALWVAMKSDWVKLSGLTFGCQVIILVTDAYPLNLRERAGFRSYVAEDYPENISDMEDIWKEKAVYGSGKTQLSKNSKRLLLFAPEGADKYGHSWETLIGWENTAFIPVDTSQGLNGMSLEELEKFIDIGAILLEITGD